MTTPGVIPETEQLNIESLTFGDVTWVNIEKPTEKEIEYLAQNYPFHHLDLDDCLSRIQRPKIDEYHDYLFIVFHFPVFHKEARVTTVSQLSVFIGDGYLITLHRGELKPLVKLFRECQIDEESLEENFSQGPGYILYRITDRLVDYCLPIVNKIIANVETVEDNIFSDHMGGSIREISMLRRDIISFRRIVWPMRAVLSSIEPKIRRFTRKDLAVYFGDTVDHLDKIWDALDEYKEVIEGLNDTHDSLASNRTNDVMRMLTIIATIMLPITVVASIFGMNYPLPFQNSPVAIIFVFVIIMVIILGMLWFFRKQHWI